MDDEKLIRKLDDIYSSQHWATTNYMWEEIISAVRAHDREGLEEWFVGVEYNSVGKPFTTGRFLLKEIPPDEVGTVFFHPVYLPRPVTEKQKVARELREMVKPWKHTDDRVRILKAAELLEESDGGK